MRAAPCGPCVAASPCFLRLLPANVRVLSRAGRFSRSTTPTSSLRRTVSVPRHRAPPNRASRPTPEAAFHFYFAACGGLSARAARFVRSCRAVRSRTASRSTATPPTPPWKASRCRRCSPRPLPTQLVSDFTHPTPTRRAPCRAPCCVAAPSNPPPTDSLGSARARHAAAAAAPSPAA
jgi:hypothetical protein